MPGLNPDDTVGFEPGKRLQPERMRKAEHGGNGADANRQRDDGERGERRRLTEPSYGAVDVGSESSIQHHDVPSGVAKALRRSPENPGRCWMDDLPANHAACGPASPRRRYLLRFFFE